MKSRVDELLSWLAGRQPTCSSCGSALIAIAGNGVRAAVCPACDVTAGVEPVHEPPHDRLHYTAIPGCSSCRRRWGMV